MSAGKTITIETVRSAIGTTPRQRGTLEALGFRKLGVRREIPDNAAVRGMIAKVAHLIRIVDNAGNKK